jgi:hypothetical protein
MPSPPLPTFFFSYARGDAEQSASPTMQKFFEDLQSALAERTPNLPDNQELGTHDRRLEQGADWDATLSAGLSGNKALVAISTPRYFGRDNCGKEIAVFALRHPNSRVERDGCLRDATNILQIRWLEDAAYEHNKVKDALVPPVLRKITWTPSEQGTPAHQKAVKRYREKGMKGCVKPGRDYYEELLRSFAQTIIGMPDLPKATFEVSWDELKSAFEAGWADKWQRTEGQASAAGPVAAAMGAPVAEPTGPADLAIFYLTRRDLHVDPQPARFADRLLEEPGWRQWPGSRADPFLSLMQGFQRAALLERLDDFHCACDPQIPLEPTRLIDQLAALTARNVVVVMSVDLGLWLGSKAEDAEARAVIEQVIASGRWGGPVVLPILDEAERLPNSPDLIAAKAGARAVVVLPAAGEPTVNAIRTALVRERGRLLRASAVPTFSEQERPPILRAPAPAPG